MRVVEDFISKTAKNKSEYLLLIRCFQHNETLMCKGQIRSPFLSMMAQIEFKQYTG